MKIAGRFAFALLPGFMGKVCADQAVVDEMGAKEMVFAVNKAHSDTPTKTLIDIEAFNV